jgi:hypothetical protein
MVQLQRQKLSMPGNLPVQLAEPCSPALAFRAVWLNRRQLAPENTHSRDEQLYLSNGQAHHSQPAYMSLSAW